MSNMKIYEQCAAVPEEAKKDIRAGRLKGMTDINPMWRIKKLTEMFGVCGFGWYTEIVEERLETVSTNEVIAFVKINLFIKMDGEWSKPIPGTGGNKLVAKETKGLHVSDECFKMAYTDALSVACKALGMGSNVYYQKDRTKYDVYIEELEENKVKALYITAKDCGYTEKEVKQIIKKKYKVDTSKHLTVKQWTEMCNGMKSNPKVVKEEESNSNIETMNDNNK